MLKAERQEVLRLRDTGTVDREVLDEVMTSLDLEESMLTIVDDRESEFQDGSSPPRSRSAATASTCARRAARRSRTIPSAAATASRRA